MELYIGGRCQEKLAAAQQIHAGEVFAVIDGGELTGDWGIDLARIRQVCEQREKDSGKGLPLDGRTTLVLDQFHEHVRSCVWADRDPFAEIHQIMEHFPELVVISDEIGCGIVPMDQKERYYREMTGRLQVEIAGKSEHVYRVTCGIPVQIK